MVPPTSLELGGAVPPGPSAPPPMGLPQTDCASALCQLKSCQLLQNCTRIAIQNGLKLANYLQCHSRLLVLAPIDRPHMIFY